MKRRNFANRMLIAVAVLFVIFNIIRFIYPKVFVVEWACFIFDAALVGGLADWFAVTALFKKPLGFPFHTAIIPNNRDKVIDALVNVVENNLLSVESINEKIGRVNMVDSIVGYIDDNRLTDRLASLLSEFTASKIGSLDFAGFADSSEKRVKAKLSEYELYPIISGLLSRAFNSEKSETYIDSIIDALTELIKKPEIKHEIEVTLQGAVDEKAQEYKGIKGFFTRLAISAAQGYDIVNIGDAAEALQQSFAQTVQKLKDPLDPVRIGIQKNLEDLAGRLKDDTGLQKALEDWKTHVLESISLKSEFENSLKTLSEKLNGQSSDENAALQPQSVGLKSWLADRINKCLYHLKNDEKLKDMADRLIKNVLCTVVLNQGKMIGELVRETLDTFTNDDLSRFVEQKVGDDLQWIRVNGSVVGGIVGAFLFLFINFVYNPLLK